MLETIRFRGQPICSQRRICREPNSSGKITLKKEMEIRFIMPTAFASFVNSRTKGTSSKTCSKRVPDQPPRESFDARRDDFVLPNFIQNT